MPPHSAVGEQKEVNSSLTLKWQEICCEKRERELRTRREQAENEPEWRSPRTNYGLGCACAASATSICKLRLCEPLCLSWQQWGNKSRLRCVAHGNNSCHSQRWRCRRRRRRSCSKGCHILKSKIGVEKYLTATAMTTTTTTSCMVNCTGSACVFSTSFAHALQTVPSPFTLLWQTKRNEVANGAGGKRPRQLPMAAWLRSSLQDEIAHDRRIMSERELLSSFW